MVAGIIVTVVADELIINHPAGHADAATVATAFGGPALFLAGHALFKFTVFGVVSVVRLAAVALLGVLVPIAAALTPLVIGIMATAVVLAVALIETLRSPGAEPEELTIET
jgi:low temperature requirement protein LtrA